MTELNAKLVKSELTSSENSSNELIEDDSECRGVFREL